MGFVTCRVPTGIGLPPLPLVVGPSPTLQVLAKHSSLPSRVGQGAHGVQGTRVSWGNGVEGQGDSRGR